MSIFIDTSVFVAYINKRDSSHDRAVHLLEDIMGGKYGRAYTSDYIFDEAVTFSLLKTKDVKKALDVGKLILGDGNLPRFTDILFVDRGVFNKAWEIFLKYGRLSFTDCTSIALMSEYEIRYIASFDSGFDGVVIRLPEY
jgi:hypothetical protein